MSCIEPSLLRLSIPASRDSRVGCASRKSHLATGFSPNQSKEQARNCRGCCCSHAMRGDNNRYYPVLKTHPINLPNQAHFHSGHCKLYRFLQPLPLPTAPLRVRSSSLRSGPTQHLSAERFSGFAGQIRFLTQICA